jgi:hypothetical protein
MFQRSAGSWVPQPYQPARSLPLKRGEKPGGGSAAKSEEVLSRRVVARSEVNLEFMVVR